MSNMAIRMEAPFLPEGTSIRYEAPYFGPLVTDDIEAMNSAIFYLREQTANRSKLDELIGKLLELETSYDGKEAVLDRVLLAVAALLPPAEKLAYANRTQGDKVP